LRNRNRSVLPLVARLVLSWFAWPIKLRLDSGLPHGTPMPGFSVGPSMPEPNISSFADLLREARQQPEPQRLLFVFAGAALPDDSTPEQRRRYAAGAGGALVPLMCVDKAPDELRSF